MEKRDGEGKASNGLLLSSQSHLRELTHDPAVEIWELGCTIKLSYLREEKAGVFIYHIPPVFGLRAAPGRH